MEGVPLPLPRGPVFVDESLENPIVYMDFIHNRRMVGVIEHVLLAGELEILEIWDDLVRHRIERTLARAGGTPLVFLTFQNSSVPSTAQPCHPLDTSQLEG